MDRFEEFLKNVGHLINTPLHPDKRRVCLLTVNHVLRVQLEHDEKKDRLLVATFVCDVPAGKFRENVLKEALKANHLYPEKGTLAYSERNNKLSLFEYSYFPELTAEKAVPLLFAFIDRATAWRQAIEQGQPGPSNELVTKPSSSHSIFGK